jgi:SagB-type dehydrogenase family enzyme
MWYRILLLVLLSTVFCQKGGGMEEIVLPKPKTSGGMSLEECVAARRSVRSYDTQEIGLEEVGQLCWVAQGITDERRSFRASPSAGATYPLELYLVKSDGLFHYFPEMHKLSKLNGSDLRGSLSQAALGQGFIEDAPLNFVIVAVYERTTRRYGERGKMYVHMEVGHAAQNIHLQAVALGLASVPVGAFYDDQVSKLLSLSEEEVPLYIVPVGYRK